MVSEPVEVLRVPLAGDRQLAAVLELCERELAHGRQEAIAEPFGAVDEADERALDQQPQELGDLRLG